MEMVIVVLAPFLVLAQKVQWSYRLKDRTVSAHEENLQALQALQFEDCSDFILSREGFCFVTGPVDSSDPSNKKLAEDWIERSCCSCRQFLDKSQICCVHQLALYNMFVEPADWPQAQFKLQASDNGAQKLISQTKREEAF